MPTTPNKLALTVAVVAALSVAASVALERVPLVHALALKSLDLQFRLRADPRAADPRVILIEVDQASLDHFERDSIPFPWPRSLYNAIVEYGTQGGARAILFDILFNNTSTYGPEVDAAFAQAMRRSDRVYLAAAYSRAAPADVEPVPDTQERNTVTLPVSPLVEAAHGIGNVAFAPDSDGVFRRAAPAVRHHGRLIPALFAAPFVAPGTPPQLTAAEFRLDGRVVPLDDEGRMWINYVAPTDAYRRYSAAAVISAYAMKQRGQVPPIPPEAFKNAYVIVGYTAPGLFDLKPTPVAAIAPAVAVHAAALDSLLNGNFLRSAPAIWIRLLAFAGAATVAAVVLLVTSVAVTTAAALVIAAALGLIAGWSFTHGWWLNAVTLEGAALLSFIGATVFRYRSEGRQRRYLERAFAQYVSPRVVRQLLAEPARLKLGGEQRTVTVLFADLAGFTGLAERLPPDELVALLNGYTTLVADAVAAHDGTVDKYIGDAVMAMWNAPVDQSDHALRAARAALACIEQFGHFVQERTALGLSTPEMRIGLSSGPCVVGNMGSANRFDYTAIGDAVNQAARLEGLNKVYGTRLLATEPTWRALDGQMLGREIDRVVVKGKAGAVRVYEVIAVRSQAAPGAHALVRGYAQLYDAYRERRWDQTIAEARDLLAVYDDGPTRVLLGRAERYRERPPSTPWDGVFHAVDK